LMLSGVVAFCSDCHAETIFTPVDPGETAGCEFCCTACDAAVFLVDVAASHQRLSRVA
jgi:hypothetical protein